MQKLVIILFVCSLTFSIAFAQDFRHGFIIKANGDSLAGFVENLLGNRNLRVCYFKPTIESKEIKYLPNELKGYGIIGSIFYETKEITIREDGRNKKVTSFVKVLVKGEASLYRYGDQFYMEKDSLFQLPKNSKEEVSIGNQTYVTTSKKYITILNKVLADCDLKAYQVSYDEQDLIKLIQKYNHCKGAAGTIFKAKKSWVKVKLDVGASIFTGIDLSDIKFDRYSLSKYSMKNSISVPVGTALELGLNNRIYFDLELWYVKKFFQGYGETGSAPYMTRYDLFIDESFLKVPLGFRYNFMRKNLTPYIKFGLVQYFPVNVSTQVLSETENYGIVSTHRYDVILDKGNPSRFWVGAGFIQKINSRFKGFLEARYEKSNSVNSLNSGSTTNFLIGLKF